MASKVLVGMSGGVDSTVAAFLLKKQGYEVTGATMAIPSSNNAQDIKDAVDAAAKLNIPHIILDFNKQFTENVSEYFFEEYRRGRTPNPCVECNRTIKFGVMLEKATELGFDYLATGHYAKVTFDESANNYLLHKGKDPKKDQSYFLYNLNRRILSSVLFPLGEITKDEAKKIAAEEGLYVDKRKESHDICFVSSQSYVDYLKLFDKSGTGEGLKEGDFVDTSGNIIGRHNGIARYTIGQRKGIGIASGEPLYVVKKDSVLNTVTLGNSDELWSSDIMVEKINETVQGVLKNGDNVQVKIRYAAAPAEGVFRWVDASRKVGAVEFLNKQRAVSPGQSAVFYNDSIVLGGGVIVG